MTISELGEVLNLKESYIRTHWPRIVKSYKKQNIELHKVGRGENARYGIKMPYDEDVVFDVDALEII